MWVKRLESINIGSQWTAYHSLNLSEHLYKEWSEIDFLLVGPQGIFIFEVKGGRVIIKDGIWEYTDRYGKMHKDPDGHSIKLRMPDSPLKKS